MSQRAVLAVGRSQSTVDPRPLLWGLWDALDHAGYRVQTYLSRAAYEPCQAAVSITGLCPRHLDSWLMTPERLRRLVERTADECDLAVAAGDLAAMVPSGERSRLEVLARQLAMPLLAMVDVRRCDPCRWPDLPANCEGVLLDGISDARSYAFWKTECESLHGLPVLGAMTACPELRDQIQPGKLPRELYRRFGQEFLRYSELAGIAGVARAALPALRLPRRVCRLKRPNPHRVEGGLRVAVAYDDAFQCYFPAIFDELEAAGATLTDFSPLADECLPPDADLVYIGCGMVEKYAAELTANTCMIAALREHVCSGKRLYAEGGGAAYLCDELISAAGTSRPMLGILPAVARSNPHPTRAKPVEVALRHASWLGERGTMLRGYRSDRWTFEPHDSSIGLAGGEDGQTEILARHHAIGGRLQLNFAAEERMLAALLRPCPPALAWAGSR